MKGNIWPKDVRVPPNMQCKVEGAGVSVLVRIVTITRRHMTVVSNSMKNSAIEEKAALEVRLA
ncbi:hypothetical protein SESBI_18218 [Sesbania bispinosa]|nr:hypothetical protein SESBI_18218 [Sesbania bispinosa]